MEGSIDLASSLDDTGSWHTYLVNREWRSGVAFEDPYLGGAPFVYFDTLNRELTFTVANGYAIYRIYTDLNRWPAPCFWGERIRADRDAYEPEWLEQLREYVEAKEAEWSP